MITQTAEYALRIVVHLAMLRGQPATTEQLASSTKIPPGYLAKVIQSLNRAGLVTSQRGRNGGSSLGIAPENLSVFAVVEAVSPFQRIRSCPLGIKSHGKSLCALHQRLDDAMATVETAFRNSTIADLLSEKRNSYPLCATNNAAGTVISKPVQLIVSRE